MMGHKNLSKSVAISAALLMALCAFAVFAVEDSDAESFGSNDVKVSGFKQDKAGTITVTVHECAPEHVVKIVALEDGVIKGEGAEIAHEEDVAISISFKLSQGTHEIVLKGYVDGSEFGVPQYVTVESADNIWSHVTSYIVLIVVVIVVIVIAVLYIRAKPNNKPTTTFTQLEEEKKAARAESTKAAAPAKTEKVKYTSSRRK
ncbi:MAG: hypothetical protein MJZ21_04465 [archaeon]|nr:hypothetical protein [archaeon]